MPTWVLSLIATISLCTWLYQRFYRNSGGDSGTAIKATLLVGALAFPLLTYIAYSLLK